MDHRAFPPTTSSTGEDATVKVLTQTICDFLISKCRLAILENVGSKDRQKALSTLASDAGALREKDPTQVGINVAAEAEMLRKRWEQLEAELAVSDADDEKDASETETTGITGQSQGDENVMNHDGGAPLRRYGRRNLDRHARVGGFGCHAPVLRNRNDASERNTDNTLNTSQEDENRAPSKAVGEEVNTTMSHRDRDSGPGPDETVVKYLGPEERWVPVRRPLGEIAGNTGKLPDSPQETRTHKLDRADSHHSANTPRPSFEEVSDSLQTTPKKRKREYHEYPVSDLRESGRLLYAPRKAKSLSWSEKEDLREQRRLEEAERFVTPSAPIKFRKIQW
jgi:hypothetical protein